MRKTLLTALLGAALSVPLMAEVSYTETLNYTDLNIPGPTAIENPNLWIELALDLEKLSAMSEGDDLIYMVNDEPRVWGLEVRKDSSGNVVFGGIWVSGNYNTNNSWSTNNVGSALLSDSGTATVYAYISKSGTKLFTANGQNLYEASGLFSSTGKSHTCTITDSGAVTSANIVSSVTYADLSGDGALATHSYTSNVILDGGGNQNITYDMTGKTLTLLNSVTLGELSTTTTAGHTLNIEGGKSCVSNMKMGGSLTIQTNNATDILEVSGTTSNTQSYLVKGDGSLHLKGTTISGTTRLTLGGNVTLENVTFASGSGSDSYAIVNNRNSARITIAGTVNTTTTSNSSIGIDADATIVVGSTGNLTTSRIHNSTDIKSNGYLEVEQNGQVSITGTDSNSLMGVTNAGTISITGSLTVGSGGLVNSGTMSVDKTLTSATSVTLGGGTLTIGDAETHDGTLTTANLSITKDSTLNANLVVSANGTLSVAHGAALTMGCSVTIGEGVTLTLDGVDQAVFASGGQVKLFDSVETLILGGTTYTQPTEGDLVIASTFANYGAADYQLVYKTDGSVFLAPEPATATLSLLALAGLCARRRRS